MKAVSLDNANAKEMMKTLEANEEPTCAQQVHLLARALVTCVEEFYRIAEIISVITPEHRAMPDEDIVAAAVSALYYASPLGERQEIMADVFQQTQKVSAVADSVEEVPDA